MTNTNIPLIRTVRIDARVEKSDGRELASDPIPCECCGRLVKKVHVLSNGNRVGSECAENIELVSHAVRNGATATDSLLYQFHVTKKQAAYLRAAGVI